MASTSRRINITVSEEMIDFYQKLSDDMGIPRSAVMVMAMKNYMDQQKSLEFGKIYKAMEELANKFQEIEDSSKSK